jgi:hypothetical protein
MKRDERRRHDSHDGGVRKTFQMPTARAEWLITAVALGIIGALLIVLAPGKQITARDAAA